MKVQNRKCSVNNFKPKTLNVITDNRQPVTLNQPRTPNSHISHEISETLFTHTHCIHIDVPG